MHKATAQTIQALVLGVAVTACPSAAGAADGQAAVDPGGGAAVEVGYGSVGEDDFLNVRLQVGYVFEVPKVGCADHSPADACQTRLRLDGQAPLRLRVRDGSPTDKSFVRRADWDEPGDYLRLIRGIEYGRATEPLHAQLGELGPVSLGHGTVVNDYYNVITVDHFQLGATASLDTVYGGAEFMLDNVVAPSVIGGRAFVRPWAWVDKDSFWSRVGLGATVVSDVDAPRRLARTTAGRQAVDDANRAVVTAGQSTSLVGVDVEAPVLESDRLGLVAYADFIDHVSLGSGLHTGVFVSVRPADSLEVLSRLEYRRIGSQYLPHYVGPLYEVERFAFRGWGQELPAPKVRATASRDTPAVDGFYGSVTARMDDLFRVSAAFSDHQGPANQTIRLQASSRPVDSVQLGLFYYKRRLDGFDGTFDFDGSLAVAETRVGVYGPVYALATYGRMWRLGDEGRYRTVDDWSLGMGASVGF